MDRLEELKRLMSQRPDAIAEVGEQINPEPEMPAPEMSKPESLDAYDTLTKMRQPEDASQEEFRQRLLREAIQKMMAKKQAPEMGE